MGDQNDIQKQLRQRFVSQVSNGYFLNIKDKLSLTEYLQSLGVLYTTEKIIDIDKPGEGNMNLVLRAKTPQRSFIIKQSRPWVEKYPHISAPAERSEIESLFYTLVQEDTILQKAMPFLIKKDPKSNILILEDLGQTSDMSDLYNGVDLQDHESDQLVQYLSQLHSRFNKIASSYYITNKDMRNLNHQHIFKIPFDKNNGLDLNSFSAGLRSVTNSLLSDAQLLKKVKQIGSLYLEDGNTLLHGDFYPGSWLRKQKKVYIIDPEFCFFGYKEFDLGVLIAHLILASQNASQIDRVLEQYKKQIEIDDDLMYSFAGVEILRRIVGVAQLPLNINLKEKKALLEMGRSLLVSPNRSNLPS